MRWFAERTTTIKPTYDLDFPAFFAAGFLPDDFAATGGFDFLNIWSQFEEYLTVVPLCKTVMAMSL